MHGGWWKAAPVQERAPDALPGLAPLRAPEPFTPELMPFALDCAAAAAAAAVPSSS